MKIEELEVKEPSKTNYKVILNGDKNDDIDFVEKIVIHSKYTVYELFPEDVQSLEVVDDTPIRFDKLKVELSNEAKKVIEQYQCKSYVKGGKVYDCKCGKCF